jgi:large subunit ribosomal protein L21
MFAIFKSGGKQYKAKAGDVLKLEKLEGEQGSTIQLHDVLLFSDAETVLGDAATKGKILAEVLEQGKGEKVIVFKKKRRHNYRRKNGHRQLLTTVRITEITSPSGKTETAAERKAALAAAKASAMAAA